LINGESEVILDMNYRKLSYNFQSSLLALDKISAKDMLLSASVKTNPLLLVSRVILPVLKQVGVNWQNGNLSLSQVYMCGRICEEITEALLNNRKVQLKFHPKIACLAFEDCHLLGKKTTNLIIGSGGYDFIDCGYCVDVDSSAKKLLDGNFQILLVSTLMLQSSEKVRALLKVLDDIGSNMKIIIGGAPFIVNGNLPKGRIIPVIGIDPFDTISALDKVSETILTS
jgi:methanogenic corrinoid protein MtbC1